MVPSRRKQQPPEPPEDDEGESRITDDRTEMSIGEGRTRISAIFGRHGRVLLWAFAWAVFFLSTMIGLSMLVKMMKDAGVLGCSIVSLTYILTCGLAYVLPPLR